MSDLHYRTVCRISDGRLAILVSSVIACAAGCGREVRCNGSEDSASDLDPVVDQDGSVEEEMDDDAGEDTDVCLDEDADTFEDPDGGDAADADADPGSDDTGEAEAAACDRGIWDGDLFLENKWDVGDVYGYTGVSGTLTIDGWTITNVDTLTCLNSVGQNLIIRQNSSLTDIDGLEGLTAIGGGLYVWENQLLANLFGLRGLTSIGGSDMEEASISIHDNASLANVEALAGIGPLAGNLSINDNPALTSLHGLEGITSIGRDYASTSIEIINNEALASIDALGNVTSIEGSITIKGNAISSVGCLRWITAIPRSSTNISLEISDNPNLPNLIGLDALVSTEGDFIIFYNPALTSLDGTEALRAVGGMLNIWNNVNLPTCEAVALRDQLTLLVGANILMNLVDSCSG